LQLNRAEFDGLGDEARTKYEGFRPGLYVRVQIDEMPAEFVDNIESTYPIILGGLLSAEQNVGYVTVNMSPPFFSFANLRVLLLTFILLC